MSESSANARQGRLVHKLCSILDAFNDILGKTAAWLVVFMVLVQIFVVSVRSILNSGSLAVEDSILYMHASLIVCCLAFTLKHDGHVRVDVFYHRFSPLTKAWVNALGSVVFLLPFAAFIFFASLDYSISAFHNREGSGDAGGLDLVYFLKALVSLAGALLFLQGLSMILHNLLVLTFKSE